MSHDCCPDAVTFIEVIARKGVERAFLDRDHSFLEIAYCPWCAEPINKDPSAYVCPCCRKKGGHEDFCMVGEEEKKFDGQDVPW